MADIFDINQRLLRLYGRDSVYDKPNWRIVWSEHQTEKRDTEYEDITDAGIYLGTKRGIREVKKYWYLPPCYILEKFHTVFERQVHDEVKEPFMFEPVYVFLDKRNQQLPLAWAPIELIISTWNKGEKAHKEHYEELEKKKLAAEQLKMRDVLEEEDPKEQPTFKSSVYVKEG